MLLCCIRAIMPSLGLEQSHEDGVVVFAVEATGLALAAFFDEAEFLVQREGAFVGGEDFELDPGEAFFEGVGDGGREQARADFLAAVFRQNSDPEPADVRPAGAFVADDVAPADDFSFMQGVELAPALGEDLGDEFPSGFEPRGFLEDQVAVLAGDDVQRPPKAVGQIEGGGLDEDVHGAAAGCGEIVGGESSDEKRKTAQNSRKTSKKGPKTQKQAPKINFSAGKQENVRKTGEGRFQPVSCLVWGG